MAACSDRAKVGSKLNYYSEKQAANLITICKFEHEQQVYIQQEHEHQVYIQHFSYQNYTIMPTKFEHEQQVHIYDSKLNHWESQVWISSKKYQ